MTTDSRHRWSWKLGEVPPARFVLPAHCKLSGQFILVSFEQTSGIPTNVMVSMHASWANLLNLRLQVPWLHVGTDFVLHVLWFCVPRAYAWER